MLYLPDLKPNIKIEKSLGGGGVGWGGVGIWVDLNDFNLNWHHFDEFSRILTLFDTLACSTFQELVFFKTFRAPTASPTPLGKWGWGRGVREQNSACQSSINLNSRYAEPVDMTITRIHVFQNWNGEFVSWTPPSPPLAERCRACRRRSESFEKTRSWIVEHVQMPESVQMS